jgi:hypothetical protein
MSEKIGNINRLVDSPNEGNPIIRTSPENAITGYEQGFGINSMLWFVKLDGKFFQGHYEPFSNSYTSLEAQDFSSFNLTGFVFGQPVKDTLTLYGFCMYQGVRFEAQDKTYSYPVYGIGGQYKLRNHTFGINWVFPGTKDFVYSKTITETPELYATTNNSFDVRYFIQFIYSYNFNKGKNVKKIDHKPDVESDTKGGGIQN